ncbi:MAG: hypothetical protein KTR24_17510 [Saprospiraceae bacterium]|nr:hypothetical protein [Saprospiraceae bacterium]
MSRSQDHITSTVSQFLHQELNTDSWTHEAHLIVAVWHLHRFSKEEATHILRCRIIEYNYAKGTGNSFASGYHETITLLWIWAIEHFIRNRPGDVFSVINAFLDSRLASGKWLQTFYSKAVLASDAARAGWVEPDLCELDYDLLANDLQ